MKTLFATTALAAGLVAAATLPASAQYWNDGWSGHRWGNSFSVNVGFGTPDNYAYGYAPRAYAVPQAGCACPPQAAYGYVGSYASQPAYGYRSYAYEPRYRSAWGRTWGGAYAYEPNYAYDPGYRYYDPGYSSNAYYGGYGYVGGGSSVSVYGQYRERRQGRNAQARFATNDRDVMRTNTRERTVRSNVRGQDTIRSQRQVRATTESTTRSNVNARGNVATRGSAEFRGGAQAQGRSEIRSRLTGQRNVLPRGGERRQGGADMR